MILNLPVNNLYFNLLYKLCCLNQLKVPGELLCSQVSSVLLLPVQPQTQHRAGITPAQFFNVELSKFIIQYIFPISVIISWSLDSICEFSGELHILITCNYIIWKIDMWSIQNFLSEVERFCDTVLYPEIKSEIVLALQVYCFKIQLDVSLWD